MYFLINYYTFSLFARKKTSSFDELGLDEATIQRRLKIAEMFDRFDLDHSGSISRWFSVYVIIILFINLLNIVNLWL